MNNSVIEDNNGYNDGGYYPTSVHRRVTAQKNDVSSQKAESRLHDGSSSTPYRSAPIDALHANSKHKGMDDVSDINGETAGILLDVVLPMTTKLQNHEDGVRDLGCCVRVGRGGPTGVSRVVLVRLTDPHDPFFLFELELLEDDYGAFKQRLELLVDFNGFPRFLVEMIQGISRGLSQYQMSFVVHHSDANRGTIRIIEPTAFKTVEHISLHLARQTDVGQKKYLAEKYKYFEHAFFRCVAERKEEQALNQRTTEDLHRNQSDLMEANRKLREELNLLTARSEKEQLAAVHDLRESHLAEIRTLRADCDEKMKTAEQTIRALQTRLSGEAISKDKQIGDLREQNNTLECSLTSVRSQLRMSEDKVRVQGLELDKLRESNDELSAFKLENTKMMSENELNYVSISERLRGALSSLRSKEDEIASLREHYQKQDEYIRILSSQNTQIAEQKTSQEKTLEKANHIISNQLQTIKNTKERFRIATEQLRSIQALLNEREQSMQRVKDELTNAQERSQILAQKNSDLREQLQKTDSARESLAQELKQNQSALLHLQRSTSINGRHWGVLAGGGSPSLAPGAMNKSAAPAGATFDLYREFGRNASSPQFSGSQYTNGLHTDVDGATPPSRHDIAEMRSSQLKKTEPKQVRAGSATPQHPAEANINKTSHASMSPPVRMPSLGSCESGTVGGGATTTKVLATKTFFDSQVVPPVSSAYF